MHLMTFYTWKEIIFFNSTFITFCICNLQMGVKQTNYMGVGDIKKGQSLVSHLGHLSLLIQRCISKDG